MRKKTAMRAMGGFALALVAAAAATSSGGCASCQLSLGGEPYGEMPDLDMQVGDTVVTEVWRYFLPEQCQGEIPFSEGHAADLDDSAAVAVSAGAELLTIVALGVADSVRVRVWSTMGGEWDRGPVSGVPRSGTVPNFHEFHVRVRPRPAGR
ncbi:MAG: hypothetical protein J4F34_09455 [Gemmatimonadetes bacterium]|nr:hypothetical protein [Gemmatimonadota bacterium]